MLRCASPRPVVASCGTDRLPFSFCVLCSNFRLWVGDIRYHGSWQGASSVSLLAQCFSCVDLKTASFLFLDYQRQRPLQCPELLTCLFCQIETAVLFKRGSYLCRGHQTVQWWLGASVRLSSVKVSAPQESLCTDLWSIRTNVTGGFTWRHFLHPEKYTVR